MPIDLNADVGEIFSELKEKLLQKLKRKPGAVTAEAAAPERRPAWKEKGRLLALVKDHQAMVGLYVFLAVGVLAFGFGYALPQWRGNMALYHSLQKLEKQQAELGTLRAEADATEKQVTDHMGDAVQLLQAFDETADPDELYQAISDLAGKNQLRVERVKKLKTTTHRSFALVMETSVAVEMSGSFADYIRFKRALAAARPLLSVEKESVKISPVARESGLHISIELTTYSLDKRPYEQLLALAEGGNDVD